MNTSRGRNPTARRRQAACRPVAGSAGAGANAHVVPIRAIVRRNGDGQRGDSTATRVVQEAHGLKDDPRIQALRLIARQLKTLTWSPELLALLLDELYVDDLFTEVVGSPDTIPPQESASAVAIAIALRHSWRPDDLAAVARQLGAVMGAREERAPQSCSRGQSRSG